MYRLFKMIFIDYDDDNEYLIYLDKIYLQKTINNNFVKHMTIQNRIIFPHIKTFRYEKCKKCNKRVVIKKNKICNNCTSNINKFNIIQTTNNNITNKLPIEIICMIHHYLFQ